VIPNGPQEAATTTTSETESESSGLSTGAIIGIAVGASVAVILACVALIVVVRRRKAAQKQPTEYSNSVHSEDSNSSPKGDPLEEKI
jgi:hypothetical protein